MFWAESAGVAIDSTDRIAGPSRIFFIGEGIMISMPGEILLICKITTIAVQMQIVAGF